MDDRSPPGQPLARGRRASSAAELQRLAKLPPEFEWERKNPGQSGRRQREMGCWFQTTIQNRGSNGCDEVSALGRPPHSLLLGHSRIGDLIDAAFRARRRDRKLGTIACPIIDQRVDVVCEAHRRARCSWKNAGVCGVGVIGLRSGSAGRRFHLSTRLRLRYHGAFTPVPVRAPDWVWL